MSAAPDMMIVFQMPSVYLAWTISDYYIPPIWEEGEKVLQSGMEQDSVRSCFAEFQRETFSSHLIRINHCQLSSSVEKS